MKAAKAPACEIVSLGTFLRTRNWKAGSHVPTRYLNWCWKTYKAEWPVEARTEIHQRIKEKSKMNQRGTAQELLDDVARNWMDIVMIGLDSKSDAAAEPHFNRVFHSE